MLAHVIHKSRIKATTASLRSAFSSNPPVCTQNATSAAQAFPEEYRFALWRGALRDAQGRQQAGGLLTSEAYAEFIIEPTWLIPPTCPASISFQRFVRHFSLTLKWSYLFERVFTDILLFFYVLFFFEWLMRLWCLVIWCEGGIQFLIIFTYFSVMVIFLTFTLKNQRESLRINKIHWIPVNIAPRIFFSGAKLT